MSNENVFVNESADECHITHINNTKAILEASMTNCQVGIDTDNKKLCFKDDIGLFHEISVQDNLAHNLQDHLNITASVNGYLYYNGSNFISKLLGTDDIPEISINKIINLQNNLNTKENISNKNQPNGYAGLDSAGKVPFSQLPSSIMEYKGNWNASTNTPSLVNGTGNTGDVYRVSVAGSQFGINFTVGDYCIYNGSTWEKSDTTDAVSSVDGLVGAVSLSGKYVTLNTIETITGSKTFASNTFFAGNIIGSGSRLLVGVNTLDEADNKYTAITAANDWNKDRSGAVIVYGNEHGESGLVRVSAGNGTSKTGAIFMDGKAYFNSRPLKDDFYTLSVGAIQTMYAGNSEFYMMLNAYAVNDTWFYRLNTAAALIKLDDAGAVEIRTAPNGTQDGTLTFNTGIYVNNQGNTAFGKSSFVGNYRLEVEGGIYSAINTGDVFKSVSGSLNDKFTIKTTSTGYAIDVSQNTDGASNKSFQLQTGGVSRIYIEEFTGDVGIGTTIPSEKLDVNGNIKLSGYLIGSGDVLRVQTNGTSKSIGIYSGGAYGSEYGATIAAYGNTNDNHGNLRLIAGAGNGSVSGKIEMLSAISIAGGSLITGHEGLAIVGDVKTGWLVNDTGTNISSLHTYYDSSLLELCSGTSNGCKTGIIIGAKGNTNTSVTNSISFFVEDVSRFRIFNNKINANGLVTIDDNPDITGDSRYSLVIKDNSSEAQGMGGGIVFEGSNDYIYGSIKGYKANSTTGNYSGQLHFQTRKHGSYPVTRMIIDEDGKVGVGLSNPQNKLHLHESSASDCLISVTNSTSGGADKYDGMTLGILSNGKRVIRTNYLKEFAIQTESPTAPGTFIDIANFQRVEPSYNEIDFNGKVTITGGLHYDDIGNGWTVKSGVTAGNMNAGYVLKVREKREGKRIILRYTLSGTLNAQVTAIGIHGITYVNFLDGVNQQFGIAYSNGKPIVVSAQSSNLSIFGENGVAWTTGQAVNISGSIEYYTE